MSIISQTIDTARAAEKARIEAAEAAAAADYQARMAEKMLTLPGILERSPLPSWFPGVTWTPVQAFTLDGGSGGWFTSDDPEDEYLTFSVEEILPDTTEGRPKAYGAATSTNYRIGCAVGRGNGDFLGLPNHTADDLTGPADRQLGLQLDHARSMQTHKGPGASALIGHN